MDIPILNREDVEDQEIEKPTVDENIRDQIVEFMKSKGYKHSPAEDGCDFFVKGITMIEVIITGGVDEEMLEQIITGTEK